MTKKTTLPLLVVLALLALAFLPRPAAAQDAAIHILFFYSNDCAHCKAVEADVLQPLEKQYGAQVAVHRFEINQPDNYEGLVRVELHFNVPSAKRGIPTLVIGEQVMIGEEEIRAGLPAAVEAGKAAGIPWPAVEGLEKLQQQSGVTVTTPAGPAGPKPSGPVVPGQATLPGYLTPTPAEGTCKVDSPSSCDTAQTVWMAYFYQVGCEVCSIAHNDINYLRQKYPNVIVEEFNIYEQAPLAEWLAQRAGRKSVHTPAVFVGSDALIGGEELTPQALDQLAQKYKAAGATRIWDEYDPSTADLVSRFKSLGPLTVVFAGLVDGLNPCAFATLVFFISYLAIAGRKGKEILFVGAAFTVGVFAAYLAVGLGFYKVLELLGDLLETISKWVYALTALLCAVLAVFSFRDYLKARRGDLGDMALNLPHNLRMRINRVIRENRAVQAYAAGALLTGVVVSFLELACTGQIYLPTIIFVSSLPTLRTRAILYLILYNLMFIVPLVVVFILAYYGTTSRDLSAFLQRRAAAVKLGMVILFAALAIWLGLSLIL